MDNEELNELVKKQRSSYLFKFGNIATETVKKSTNSKLFITIILIVLLIIVIILCNDGKTNNELQSNQSGAAIEKKEDSIYKFNADQINFLQSLGIEGVTQAKINGGKKEFFYDGETIYLLIDKNNGIESIYKNNNVELWNAQKGKVGMLRSEYRKFLSDFIDNSEQSYDQATQITWVDSGPSPFGHKGLLPYMGIKGREKKGRKWLRVKIHYSDTDWVFFTKVVFSTTERTWTYETPGIFKIDHSVVWGGIHETYDVPFEEIKPGIELLTKGSNPRIDFFGKHGRDGVELSQSDIDDLNTYLKLEQAIKNE